MFNIRRQSTPYRSFKYSSVRKDSYTADPSTVTQFRVKRKSMLESTFYKTSTIQVHNRETQQQQPTHLKQRYLQSFNSLMISQKNAKMEAKSMQSTLDAKIILPHFSAKFEEEQSEFSLLDVFRRPHTAAEKEINKNKKELMSQQQDLKHIRAQLHIMKIRVESSLKNSQNDGKKQIQRLRNIINKNEIEQYERKLKFKREIVDLQQSRKDMSKTCREQHQCLMQMQNQIFESTPFELDNELEKIQVSQ